MAEANERLVKARRRAGYTDATQAARAFGWNEITYRSHENGIRGIKRDVAASYARAFRVSLPWLLTGEGDPNSNRVVPVMGLVGAGGEIETSGEQPPPDGLYQIELPIPIPDDAIAFEVRGDSMWPRYDAGDVVVCWKFSEAPEDMIGHEAVVLTDDGRRFLKRLLRGSAQNVYDLESHNAPPMRGIRVRWAAKVNTVVRAAEWRQVMRARR